MPYILDRFVGFIDKFKHIGTILKYLFFLVSLWSRGWRSDPTSVLPIGMPLSPITRATVVFSSELEFAVSIRFVIFDRFLLGNSRRRIADICALNVTEKGKQIQTC